MGVPEDAEFYVPPEALTYLAERKREWEAGYRRWQATFRQWAEQNPEQHAEWVRFQRAPDPRQLSMPSFRRGETLATRVASGKVLESLAAQLPNMVGGSADLLHSTSTQVKGFGGFGAEEPAGRNIYFGIREHAMAAVANGIAVGGLLRVYCSTYLVFSDYMRPSIRLAAMMKLPVIYIFTHDSVFVGEDGPTHQPVEQVASLRAVPGLLVLRPGDAEETVVAWRMAMAHQGPTALVLSRQALPVYEKHDAGFEETLRFGAYVVSDSAGAPRTVLVASGSEVSLALETKRLLGDTGIRVVSVMCRELFLRAPRDVRESLIPAGTRRIVVEAGISQGWEGIAGDSGLVISIEDFGKSAPMKDLATLYGFTAAAIGKRVNDAVHP